MLAKIIIPINITDLQVLRGTPNPQSLGDTSLKCAAHFFKAGWLFFLTGNGAMTLGHFSPPFTTHRVEIMACSQIPNLN